MNMTNEKEEEPSSNVEKHVEVANTTTQRTESSPNVEERIDPHNTSSTGNMARTNVSYSGMAQSAAKPNNARYTNNKTNAFPRTDLNFWTSQLKQILMHHNNGSRVLIIMRGVPGSGKTYLAKKILEATIGGSEFNFLTHIFSADDYFIINGHYRYDKMKLQDAHIWNRTKARSAMERGVSPVIIDNTNVEMWEMEPYIRDGVNNGYLIEIVEPSTPWARRANQLSRKNVHNVPLHKIKRMLTNYQEGITARTMINHYKLSYPNHMIPPILRNYPVITIETIPEELDSNLHGNAGSSVQHSEHNCNTAHENVQNEENIHNPLDSSNSDEQIQNTKESNDDFSNNDAKNNKSDNNLEKPSESNMQFEELERIVDTWDTNEKWEDDPSKDKRTSNVNDVSRESETAASTKPPRRKINKLNKSLEDTKPEVDNLFVKCQDWTKIDMFMQPWDDNCQLDEVKPLVTVEKVNSGTCVEPGDTDICDVNKASKVLNAEPRDINLYYMPLDKEKIPEKRMLDKSSMVNEQTLAEEFKSNDSKTRFKLFRNLFINIPKSELKDIFDLCKGDVSWATNIVLEGLAIGNFSKVTSEDSSDSDEEDTCVDDKTSKHIDEAGNKAPFDDSKPSTSSQANEKSDETINNIIPNDNSQPCTSVKPNQLLENSAENVIIAPRKGKKANTSEYHMNLKRQIEKNVVISEDHYSKHCLKIRNQRQGIRSDVTPNESVNQQGINGASAEVPGSTTQCLDGELPSTSNGIRDIRSNYNNNEFGTESNSDDSENNFDKSEKTVNVNLSWDFISKLDEHFGRDDMVYPEHVLPILNIPESLLNEINAFWMESFLNQSEAKFKETELMIQQDEAIARELESQEFELYEVVELEIPDFKDLIDNELALALQNKFDSEWRKDMPMDLAAKLTRQKLNNLFPEIHPQILSELLIAHNNNFRQTVEGLLLSTGKTEILERENGVRDFIMAKGTEHREKIRNERKQELLKNESLFLSRGERADMKLVERYRQEAELHLTRRNQIYQKIRDNMSQGRIQVAWYYSEIAAMHTQQYDHANSLAVATLIQVGSSKNSYTATLDLHHLRVREAMESLDLFLDANINRLREIQGTSNIHYMTLYFITGRGLHSHGLPKIKPAVQRRLGQRAIAFKERNPGLLMAKVYAGHRMTHEVA